MLSLPLAINEHVSVHHQKLSGIASRLFFLDKMAVADFTFVVVDL